MPHLTITTTSGEKVFIDIQNVAVLKKISGDLRCVKGTFGSGGTSYDRFEYCLVDRKWKPCRPQYTFRSP